MGSDSVKPKVLILGEVEQYVLIYSSYSSHSYPSFPYPRPIFHKQLVASSNLREVPIRTSKN
jgi:hypothetical protein